MKVFKFGGASVKDAAAFRNIAEILKKEKTGNQLVIVVSAMGKTTNALEIIFDKAIAKLNFESEFENLRNYHFQTLLELFPNQTPVFEETEKLFFSLKTKLESLTADSFDKLYDQIISYGELLSSTILHYYLENQGYDNQWIDSRKYIQTDNTWREAKVNWEWTEKLVQRDFPHTLRSKSIVTQGFIGGTNDGLTTTLGREGSDFSAAIFACCLNAESLTIWKDVEGLLNADPKHFSDTVKYDRISYHDTVEMAYYGATVIHPKTIKPLANKNIELYVRSFLETEKAGTHIGDFNIESLAPAIILKPNQALISFGTKDFTFISEKNLGTIFNALSELRIKINMMQNSAISFSICTDFDEKKLAALIKTLSNEFTIYYNLALSLYTIKNYNNELIERMTSKKTILLEQKTRQTYQFICKTDTSLYL